MNQIDSTFDNAIKKSFITFDNRDQLCSLFQHTDTSSNTYQPSYIIDAATSSIQNVFMQLISSISNPFINFLVTTAFVLSLIWSIVLTTWTLRMCASFLIQKVKNQTHPPNNSVPEVWEVIILHCVLKCFFTDAYSFVLYRTEFP